MMAELLLPLLCDLYVSIDEKREQHSLSCESCVLVHWHCRSAYICISTKGAKGTHNHLMHFADGLVM